MLQFEGQEITNTRVVECHSQQGCPILHKFNNYYVIFLMTSAPFYIECHGMSNDAFDITNIYFKVHSQALYMPYSNLVDPGVLRIIRT
jgi:hypothetical protein